MSSFYRDLDLALKSPNATTKGDLTAECGTKVKISKFSKKISKFNSCLTGEATWDSNIAYFVSH